MTLTFRDAERGDLPALVALLADDVLGAAREDVRDPPAGFYVRALDRVLENPHDAIVIADVGGEVAGCAQLTILHGLGRKGAMRGQVEGVRVASAHRGEGIGEKLMAHVIERARRAGCAMVQLTSDKSRERAHVFYERLGFIKTHVGMKLELL